MIAVAIIVVLSVIAVMSYRRFTARARATEVHAMFAEIRSREESYRAEFSAYLNVSGTESTLYPVLGSAGQEPRAKTWAPAPANWNSLGVRPPTTQVYCSYSVVAGTPGNWNGTGSNMQASLGTVPQVAWWAAVAMCDNDGTPGTLTDGNNARFSTSSLGTTVIETNATR